MTSKRPYLRSRPAIFRTTRSLVMRFFRRVGRRARSLAGPARGQGGSDNSRLYAADYDRRFRAGRADMVRE